MIEVFNLGTEIAIDGRPEYGEGLEISTYGVRRLDGKPSSHKKPSAHPNHLLWKIGELLELPVPKFDNYDEIRDWVSGKTKGDYGWVARDEERAKRDPEFRPISQDAATRYYLPRHDVAKLLFDGARAGSTIVAVAEVDEVDEERQLRPIVCDDRIEPYCEPGFTVIHRRTADLNTYPFHTTTLIGLPVVMDLIRLTDPPLPL